MKEDIEDSVSELMDIIEENNISDVNDITWLSDTDCYIESSRSVEFKELIKKVLASLSED